VDQTLFNIAVALAGALGGWWMKAMWDSMKEMQRDMREIERELPENYVRKDDFKDVVRDIRQDMKDGFNKMEATLGLIFKRLEQKEDK
jgi:hypothetical protein